MENDTQEGNENVPFFYFMIQETNIQAIESLVQKILLETEDIFLVSVKVKPINNIKVFLDADSGLNIDKCVKINRAMYRTMEEEAWYPDGNFSLEVSSPGIEEPLKLVRQYKKNIGREVEVTLNDDAKFSGKLLDVTDDEITVEHKEGKNKKLVTLTKAIAFTLIKQTVVLIAF